MKSNVETYVRTDVRTKSGKPHVGRLLLGPAKITKHVTKYTVMLGAYPMAWDHLWAWQGRIQGGQGGGAQSSVQCFNTLHFHETPKKLRNLHVM